MRIRVMPAGLVLALAASVSAAAIETTIDRAAIERALSTAKAPDAARARFHARYIAMVDDPTVERVEIITEFRRVVLSAEERLRFGDHLFGVRQAAEMLRPWRKRVSVVAHLRFHPQNNYIGVPSVEITVPSTAGERPPVPLELRRLPQYSLPSSTANTAPGPGLPGQSGTALLGATIEAIFDTETLPPTRRQFNVLLFPKELARVTFDLSSLD